MKFLRAALASSLALILLSGCKAESDPASAAVVTVSPTDPTSPTPSPTPPPPPPVGSEVPAGTMEGLASIASNFDIGAELVDVPPAPLGSEDVVGAFRFVCNAAQVLYDDPIVYPGQPGRSHLHQFFGNTGANASSTYESLRSSGDSTCMNRLNRSAYWMPAMLNGRGQVVRPDYITIYYKRYPKDSSYCTQMGKGCVNLPRGLRYIFGYNMVGGTDPEPASHYFTCEGANRSNNIVDTAKYCTNGQHLGVAAFAPMCWNGKDLDSPDHRSHMAYPSYGSWGYLKCPDTHPYVVADFAMVAWFTVDDTLDKSGTWTPGVTKTWSLASDSMPGMTPARPGSTLHADWWGAWDDTVMKTWHDNCIDRKLSCNSGDLGNGKALKMFSGFSWNANPRLIALPTP